MKELDTLQYWRNSRIYGMSIFQTTGHDLKARHDINLVRLE